MNSERKKLQFKDINERYSEDPLEQSLSEALLPRHSSSREAGINLTQEDTSQQNIEEIRETNIDVNTKNARLFEAVLENKELGDIQDQIDEYFGYVILIWILFIVHLINLGYFLFMIFLNFNSNSSSLNRTFFWATGWNTLQLVIWWHAFLGREQQDIKKQNIAVYGLIIAFGIMSVGMIFICFGSMLMPDILFEAASGVMWIILKQSGLEVLTYLFAVFLEIIVPIYMFINIWKLRDILGKRNEVLETDRKTRSLTRN